MPLDVAEQRNELLNAALRRVCIIYELKTYKVSEPIDLIIED